MAASIIDFRQWLKWGLFLPIASLLAWRIIILGVAEHYARHLEMAPQALTWYRHHPQALFDEGTRLMQNDPTSAEALLRKAARENPTDGRVYISLARLWENRGEREKAAELIAIASGLAPMYDAVQIEVAAFWSRQGRLDLAIGHWNTVLRMHPSIRHQLYPALLRLAEDPHGRTAFMPLFRQLPVWWEDFFGYAATNAVRLDTVRRLYQLRQQHSGAPSTGERDRYMARLQRDGYWLEAYFTWLNSLDSHQLAALGNLYNGSFERPLTDEGFDWRTPPVRGVKVETAPTYGIRGDRAMRVVFQGQQVRFRHLYQHLFLDPGRYRLRGQVRPDSLRTARGVQWTLRCAVGNSLLLGVSDRFLGTDQWRQFTMEFEVPAEDCSVQLLRLELIGRIASEFQADGVIWFDDLAIERVD